MSIATELFATGFAYVSEILGRGIVAKRPHDASFAAVAGVVLSSQRNDRVKRSDGGIDVIRVRDVVATELNLPGAVARIDLVWQIEGDNYSTVEFNRVDGGFVSFKVQRNEAAEITRKNYRGSR